MTETIATIFEQSLERYQNGEAAEKLIPVFSEICNQAPKNASAWSCLAWLYLLVGKSQSALKAAKKSVKLEPQLPQARVNLVLAMLETKTAGVRQHIEIIQQMMSIDEEIAASIKENVEDGFNRKPDWKSLEKVKNYLNFEAKMKTKEV